VDIREQQQATSTTRHPWERARRRVVQRLVARHAPTAHVIVDIGAGDGFVGEAFVEHGCHVVAVDPAASGDHLQRLRTLGIDARTSLPDDNGADVALLLDVIEHVSDDVALLKQAAQQVTARGIVVVTVPAWPALFSTHDTALGHHRRYTQASLRAAIAASGLELVDDGALFSSLLLPRALQVVRERWAPPSAPSTVGVGQFTAPAVVATALAAILDVDAHLTQRLHLPGLSLFAVARQKRS
jgi:SAM-dependent methyltransferase